MFEYVRKKNKKEPCKHELLLLYNYYKKLILTFVRINLAKSTP